MLNKLTKSQKGFLFTFLGATFWGLSGVLGEYLLNVAKFDSLWVINNRILFAGLIILCYLYKKEKNELFLIFSNKIDCLRLVNFAFVGLLLCQGAYFLAIKYTNAGTATILQYIGPTIIMIYYCVVRKRLPQSNEFLAIILSLVGVLIISTQFDFSKLVISPLGLFWGLMSAIGLVTYNIFSLKLIGKYGVLKVIAWAMFIAGVVMDIVCGTFYLPSNFGMLDLLLFIGVILFGTILSYAIYLSGVQLIGAVKGSIIACFEPIAAIIFSILFIGTSFTIFDLFGAFLILFAVVVLNKK